MADTPEWFTTEILRRLSGVRRGKQPGQFYARCPAHDDKHASLAIRAGDDMPLIYWCHAVPGCEQTAIRVALAGLGVPDEHLGQYGTPEYLARRKTRTSSDDWREIERLRYEMLELKATLRGLLDAELTLAMVKVRLLAVSEGVEIPVARKEYIPFAMRAGVSQPRAYAAWKSDPLVRASTQCVTGDHVVLTRPGEERQAAQVNGSDGIIEARKPFSEREFANPAESGLYRNDNSRNENDKTAAALDVLNAAGLTKPAA